MVKCTNPKYNRPCILTNAYASVTQTPSRSQTCPPQTFLTPPSQLSPPPLPSFPPPEVTLFWILWPEMSFACSRAPWSVSCVGFFCSSCVLRFIYVVHGLPSWLNSKEPTCRLQFRNHRICGFDSWVGKTPWRRKWHPAPGFWPGKSHGQRRLAAYSPGGCKSQTRGSACVSVVVSVFVSFLFLPQFISLVDRLVSCFLFGFL